MEYALLDQAVAAVKNRFPNAQPACGLILGSGWGDVVGALEPKESMPYDEIPGLGQTGVQGHAGTLSWSEGFGVETLIFQGRRHWYEGEGWTPIAAPVYILKRLGAEVVVLTNAAGGIGPDLKPGDLMIIEDHILNIPAHPLAGPHHPVWGPRFPDQSEVYDHRLIKLLSAAGTAAGKPLKKGVYQANPGPTYETPAEIRCYQTWGANAVGMSTVPEAMLANAAGLKVAAMSCISNFAAGISEVPLTHDEVTDTTRKVMPIMRDVLANFWKEMKRDGIA